MEKMIEIENCRDRFFGSDTKYMICFVWIWERTQDSNLIELTKT